MPRIGTIIKGLLVCSILVGGAPLAAAPARANAGPPAAQAGDGALAEREKGRAQLRQGKAAEALIHLESALKLFQQAGDKLGEASVNDLLGELYERQGRYDVALKNFESAYEYYAGEAARPANNIQVVKALSPKDFAYNANLMLSKIGNVHLRRGDRAKARAAFARMRVTKPDQQSLEAAAQTSVTSGNPLAGANQVKRGITGIFGGGSKKPSASSPTAAVNSVADTANRLQAPFTAYRETVIYTTYELGLGRVAYLSGQYEQAGKHFDNVLSATVGSLPVVGKLRQTRRYRAAARTGLGDIAFQQGNYAEAVKLYDAAAKSAQSDERLDLMWPAQRGTGRSLWAQSAQERDPAKSAKLRAESLAAFRSALSTIETIRQGSLRADEARTTFLATTEDVFDEASAAFAESALLAQGSSAADAPLAGPALEHAAEGLRVVEQGRARSLLDMLGETGAEITEGVPADLLQRKQENQARQQEIASQLTGVTVSADGPKRSLSELEEELNRLQTEYDSIENQIRAASPRYAALTTTQPLTLAEIQQRVLDEQTALLEYSLGEKTSYLYAATKTGAALYRLPARAEVERQAVAVREQIIPATLRRALTDSTGETKRGITVSSEGAGSLAAGNYAGVANALYKMVVEPAARFAGERRLLIVADGALNYVPFHALVTARPASGAEYATLSYVLKTNETVYAPSASVVAAIRQQAQASGGAKTGGSMLLVADPVFGPGDARAKGAPAPASDTGAQADASRGLSGVDNAVEDINAGRESAGGPPSTTAGGVTLARLAGTREEAQQIAGLARTTGTKADVWLDLDANESNVEARDLRQYRVVHFATHGLLNAERPQFTGVVLSLVGNKASEDGFLRTDEIFNLKLSSPLVMLSACETGLGKEKKGEGVIGLTRAFMYAGAPTVGVSLWSVADKSTADLMTDFYRNLFAKEGTAPAAAMRAARQKMIADKKYSAPFYWAPFVLVGDWQ
ncbi:MAG TPA: CHAT domain-containing protein [Pyrinomonadaceae bacterium]